MSGRVVSDIQARAEDERLMLIERKVYVNDEATISFVFPL